MKNSTVNESSSEIYDLEEAIYMGKDPKITKTHVYDNEDGSYTLSVTIDDPDAKGEIAKIAKIIKSSGLEYDKVASRSGGFVEFIVTAFDDEDEKFVLESDGDGGYIDDYGQLIKPLPMDCILDCSGSGRVDDQVAYWVDKLGFDIDMPRGKAIKFLSEYGAWESDELEDMDIIELAEKVLWIFCGNIKEEAYEFMSGSMDYEDVDPSQYPEDINDWEEKDWERFQNEVSVQCLA